MPGVGGSEVEVPEMDPELLLANAPWELLGY